MDPFISPYMPLQLTEEERRLAEKRRKLEEPTEEKAQLAPLKREAAKLLTQFEKKVRGAEPRIQEIKVIVEELAITFPAVEVRMYKFLNEFERLKIGGAASFSSVIWQIDHLTRYEVYQDHHLRIPSSFKGSRGLIGAMDCLLQDIEAELAMLQSKAKGG